MHKESFPQSIAVLGLSAQITVERSAPATHEMPHWRTHQHNSHSLFQAAIPLGEDLQSVYGGIEITSGRQRMHAQSGRRGSWKTCKHTAGSTKAANMHWSSCTLRSSLTQPRHNFKLQTWIIAIWNSPAMRGKLATHISFPRIFVKCGRACFSRWQSRRVSLFKNLLLRGVCVWCHALSYLRSRPAHRQQAATHDHPRCII